MLALTAFLVVGLAATAFWIWMIVDCMTHESDMGNTKIAWILVIVLTHLIGALIYYFVRRPERPALAGSSALH